MDQHELLDRTKYTGNRPTLRSRSRCPYQVVRRLAYLLQRSPSRRRSLSASVNFGLDQRTPTKTQRMKSQAFQQSPRTFQDLASIGKHTFGEFRKTPCLGIQDTSSTSLYSTCSHTVLI